MLRRAFVCALVATALLGATEAGAARNRWSSFSTAPVVNFADPALHRTPDGVLHILWVQDDGAGAEDLFQTTISATGDVATATPILTDWSSMWGGGGDIAAMSDGRLQYFFGGLRGNTTGQPNDNMSMVTSDAAGTSWTLKPGEIVEGADGAAYATTVGASAALDGTPFQTFGGRLHRGTNPNTGVIDVHDSIGGSCCAYDSDIATDQTTGQMYFGWFSNATNQRGVWAHEIDPSSGALVGGPMLMPGVTETTTEGGEPQAGQSGTRIPITGRPGHDGVYVAYTGGYPSQWKVLVWRVGAPVALRAVQNRDQSFDDPAIAADPQGRLWVGWSRGSNLYFRRSNPEATQWGRTISIPAPRDTTSIFDLKLSAQDTFLDIVGLFDTYSTSPTLWTRQLGPPLRMRASRDSVVGSAKVEFTVDDAGVPVPKAGVTIAGRSGVTNAAGKVTLQVGPVEKPTRLTARATKPGYEGHTVEIRVRPR